MSRVNMRVSAIKKEDRINEKRTRWRTTWKTRVGTRKPERKTLKSLEKVAKPLRKKPRVTRVNARVYLRVKRKKVSARKEQDAFKN